MKISHRLSLLLLSAGLLGSACAQAASAVSASSSYFRFPAVRGDTVVFTAEGDLWKSNVRGGPAQRLTTHPGYETNAAISRDGQWVAFSASYEGAQDAYVMPLAGGLPRRISYDNGGVLVLGWTAQGEVLISTQNTDGPASRRIVAAVDPLKLTRRVFPVADANDAVLDDAGTTLYFTRFGLAMTNDNVRNYRGGAHAQLWRFALDGKSEAQPMHTDAAVRDGNNKRPMWWQGRVYYISDESGSDNLWSMLPDGSDRRALTRHVQWDVRNAQLGDGKIVYQLGADLHLLDLSEAGAGAIATQSQPLPISLLSDFDQQRARQIRSPLDTLSNVQISGKDERIILTARGRVSIAGTGSQRRVDIAIPEGARARDAVLSSDEKSVFAIVDTSGENEIWQYPADGSGPGVRLTNNGDSHRWKLYPSPDGRYLAHSDKKGRFWLLDLASKANTLIDDAGKAGVDKHDEVQWSPDSRNLALVRVASNEQREQIGLYNLAEKQLHFVTSDRYTSGSPMFSPDGHWLYFLSARNFQLSNGSPWGDRNMGPVFDKRVGVYALALQPGNRFPFQADDELSRPGVKPAETDDEKAAELAAEKAVDKKVAKSAVKKAPAVLPAIVTEGLAARLYEVPLAAGNYQALAVDDKRLYFLEADSGAEGKSSLKTLAIGNTGSKPELLVANVREFDLAADKKHLYYRTASEKGAGEMLVIEAGAKLPTDLSKAKVKVDDWTFVSNPRLEWQQMFNDAWRLHRDFLYDAKMRGVDWNAARAKYAPLVERVTDRAELNDLLGMMVAEVGALHSQIRPGELRRTEQEGAPSGLGAVLVRTDEGYQVEHIYRSEPELPSERAPLSRPEVDVKEGDVITAVNGKDVLQARDIADLLLNQADKQVLLQVKRGKAAPRAMIVTPVNMARQTALRYGDWELSRAEQVASASQGRIGYLHLRAMGARDIASFARDFYANINREGLIIDVRRNNGGNIDSWIIEKLLRKAWAFWAPPGVQPSSNMQNTFRGHLVVLVDELTYSDGETFAAGIKALGLAPLVGKRTAGAGVWLSDNTRLLDNGMARVAENGQFGADGQWLIEGVGVVPDVEVDNPPHATFNGGDRQLEVALGLLDKKLREQPLRQFRPQAIPALKPAGSATDNSKGSSQP